MSFGCEHVNFMQVVNNGNPQRCECHECTQARWKMSFQGQFQASMQDGRNQQTVANKQVGQTEKQ